jgi:F0F1-type ATP synthase membrane subunit b/b'
MWHDPYIYMVISFIIFLWFIGRPLYGKFLIELRERSLKIEEHIREVESLYQEAQSILIEQKNVLKTSEQTITILEAETQERVRKIKEEQETFLNALEETAAKDLKKEVASLKEDFKASLQEELLHKSYRNVQWIIKNKLTDEQKEKLTSHAIDHMIPDSHQGKNTENCS